MCWRFHKYLLQADEHEYPVEDDVDWSSYSDVVGKVWNPFFGTHLNHENGVNEHTFPYVLRHTQMRPRQLMMKIGRVHV